MLLFDTKNHPVQVYWVIIKKVVRGRKTSLIKKHFPYEHDEET